MGILTYKSVKIYQKLLLIILTISYTNDKFCLCHYIIHFITENAVRLECLTGGFLRIRQMNGQLVTSASGKNYVKNGSSQWPVEFSIDRDELLQSRASFSSISLDFIPMVVPGYTSMTVLYTFSASSRFPRLYWASAYIKRKGPRERLFVS